MTETPTRAEGGKRATLSRELSEFLIELSIGVHRYAMYPPGHPSLAPVVENVIGRLGRLVADRSRLTIGVAQRQLVIEGVATDSRHPVLSDLARRLHDHQLAALAFSRGARAPELEGLLERLSKDTEREHQRLGTLSPEELPSWEHVRVFPVGYDQLTIREDGQEEAQPDRVTQLWLGLAQSAMATDESVDQDTLGNPRALARIIHERGRDGAYDEVIVGYLRQLAEQLGDERTAEAEKIRRRVSTLIEELDQETLARLLSLGGSGAQRKKFLLDANHSLAVDAVVKVLEAAAATSGQTISSSLTRMLTKLAGHAEQGVGRLRAQADTALRENVEELIEDWELKDPNPDQYTALLDTMARATPVFQARVEREEPLSGPRRVMDMAIEVDAFGPTVRKAVADLLDLGESRFLLDLVDGAPPGNRVAERVRKHLASPRQLRRLLAGSDVDEQALSILVERMGTGAVDPLLDVLTDSDSRAVRRKVFDLLLRLGPFVAQRAAERLEDNRWFVQRNMLALLQRLGTLPPGFDALRYTRHEDHRVRREAFALALKDGSLRERTLASALAEKDERLVRMALAELRSGVPESLVPILVNRVVNTGHSAEIRAMGARALGRSRSQLARETLLNLTVGGRSLFGRARLADKSPEVLAALSALARAWPADDEVRRVMTLAARSKDPQIQSAVAAAQEAQP